MTESIVEKELKTCGKAFFVEYFSALNQIDWHNENQVEKIKKYISEDLIYKRRPDGGKYTEAGLAMRFSSFFVIFSQGLQWEALKNISESKGLSQEVRQSAKMYIEREKHLRKQREESAINNVQNEHAKLMQEFLHRKKEEEKAREEAKRKQEEKIAICNAREELIQEKEEQEKIIALNRGWFFGKKAKICRAAKRRLQEIENELEKIENKLEEIENELEDFPTFQ